jgi:hypothetical protein
MCGLPPGDNNMTSGGHGDSMPANSSPPIYYPTGEVGKNPETGFIRCSPKCHYKKKQREEKDKIWIYIVKANFSKIVAFIGMIEIFKIKIFKLNFKNF